MKKPFFTILIIASVASCGKNVPLKNNTILAKSEKIQLTSEVSGLCQYCENNQTDGHRGGGDEDYCPFPENSLLALNVYKNCGVANYLEFDVNSTDDHNLVVFHGPQLWKFIELNDVNNEIFKKIYKYKSKDRDKLTIQDVKYQELKDLQFKLNGKAKKMKKNGELPPIIIKQIKEERVPLLSDYLNKIYQLAISETLRFDIKMIKKKEEMEYLFTLIDRFKLTALNNIEISLTTKWAQGRRWQRLPDAPKRILCKIGMEKNYLVNKIQKKCKKFLSKT